MLFSLFSKEQRKSLYSLRPNVWTLEGFDMASMWEPSLFDQRADLGSVPDFRRFREVVDHIENKRNACLIKMLYLGAYRINEILTKINAYE